MFQKGIKEFYFKLKYWNKDVPVFIHIPKTAGSYMRQMQSDFKPVIWPIQAVGHAYFVGNEKIDHSNENYSAIIKNGFLDYHKFRKRIFFTTVRNPFDFLVSWASHAGGWDKSFENKKQYDFDLANKSFDYFIKTLSERDGLWPNKKFLYYQLFNSDGEFLPDFICRQETLDFDLSQFAEIYNLQYSKKNPQRVSRAKKDYRSYYTDDLIDLVNRIWERELSLYGYNFDGPISNRHIYYQKVSSFEKKALSYNLKNDRLLIHKI